MRRCGSRHIAIRLSRHLDDMAQLPPLRRWIDLPGCNADLEIVLGLTGAYDGTYDLIASEPARSSLVRREPRQEAQQGHRGGERGRKSVGEVRG